MMAIVQHYNAVHFDMAMQRWTLESPSLNILRTLGNIDITLRLGKIL